MFSPHMYRCLVMGQQSTREMEVSVAGLVISLRKHQMTRERRKNGQRQRWGREQDKHKDDQIGSKRNLQKK